MERNGTKLDMSSTTGLCSCFIFSPKLSSEKYSKGPSAEKLRSEPCDFPFVELEDSLPVTSLETED